MDLEFKKNCVSIIPGDGFYPYYVCDGRGQIWEVGQSANGIKLSVYFTLNNKYNYIKFNGYYNRHKKILYLIGIDETDGRRLVIVKCNGESANYYASPKVYESGLVSLVGIYGRIYMIYSRNRTVYVSHVTFICDRWANTLGTKSLCHGSAVIQCLEGGKGLNCKRINNKEMVVLVNSNELYHYEFDENLDSFYLANVHRGFNAKPTRFRDFEVINNMAFIVFTCSQKNGMFILDVKENTMKQYERRRDRKNNQYMKDSFNKICKDRKLHAINRIYRTLLVQGYCTSASLLLTSGLFVPAVISKIVLLYLFGTLFTLDLFHTEFTMNCIIKRFQPKRVTVFLDPQSFK